jgi:hypothetical protein
LENRFLKVVALVISIGSLAACSGSKGDEPADDVGGKDGGGGGGSDGSSSSKDGGSTPGLIMGLPPSDAAPPPLDGGTAVACTNANLAGTSWEVSGGGVIVTLAFEDSAYTVGVFVPAATAGDFDEEEIIGNYMVSNALLTTTPTAQTCPIPATAGIAACIQADGDLFTTNTSGSTTVWTPHTGTVASGTVTLGCGTPFVQYPVTTNP